MNSLIIYKTSNCDFSELHPSIECSDTYSKVTKPRVTLQECLDDTERHLRNINVLNTSNTHNQQILHPKEYEIILARSKIDPKCTSLNESSICIKHRKLVGLQWEPKIRCCSPDHKTKQAPQKHISFERSTILIRLGDYHLIEEKYKECLFGSLICKDCNSLIDDLLIKQTPLSPMEIFNKISRF